MITVRFFAAAREASHTEEDEVTAGTVAELIAMLSAEHGPRMAEVLSYSTLLVAGERVPPGSDRPLAPGDTVDVLPPFAGG